MSKLPVPIKEELSKVSQAIALSMLIDLIMMNYNPKGHREERTEAINKIKLRVKKYINKKAKSNKRDFQRSLLIVKEIWNETLDHYEEVDLTIESVSTVIRFHAFYAEILSKNVGLTDKLIEKFSFGISQSSTVEIEQNSYKMADMILNKLAVYTGVKPLSFKERLEKYKKEKENNE